MARSIIPHFPHHQRELQLTRRRFSWSLLLLCMVISCLVGLQYQTTMAATRVTISGRVYNMTTGAGIPNIKIRLCSGNPDVVTNSTGKWSYTLDQWSWFCAEYKSGAPASVSYVDAPNRTAEAKSAGVKYYEWQVAGVNCYHSSSCSGEAPKQDRSVDYGYDFRFKSVPTPTPTPKPAPTATPKPAPTATPRPTSAPSPVRTPTPNPVVVRPGGAAGGTAGNPAAAPATPDTTPPSAPGSFQALSATDNAVIDLEWTAATDNQGIKEYQLERSTDQTAWSALAVVAGLKFQDDGGAFGTKYFYRLRAVDAAGNASPYVTAEASTPDFAGNSSGETDTTFTSDDQLVNVLVPAGALDATVDCSVIKDDQALGTKTRPMIAGAYQLLCKTAGGDIMTVVNKPVVWTYQLSDNIKGYTDPRGVTLDAATGEKSTVESAYDRKTKTLQFKAAQAGTTAVLAAEAKGLPLNLIAIVVVVILVIVGLVIFILRRSQRQRYDDYLRSKYYNL